jgi:holo-[acyl-carrier protein] synthase
MRLMIVGVGIDVAEIDRFSRALRRTPALAERLFTERERGLPVRSLAARFAAKEALAKALGGPSGLLWTDAEVITAPDGKPSLKVTGTVAEAARKAGVSTWHVSLSHDGGVATAIVIAESVPQTSGSPGLGWV